MDLYDSGDSLEWFQDLIYKRGDGGGGDEDGEDFAGTYKSAR